MYVTKFKLANRLEDENMDPSFVFGGLLSRIHKTGKRISFRIGFPNYQKGSKASLGEDLNLFTNTEKEAIEILSSPSVSAFIIGHLVYTPPVSIEHKTNYTEIVFRRIRSRQEKLSPSRFKRRTKRFLTRIEIAVEIVANKEKIATSNKQNKSCVKIPCLFVQSCNNKQIFPIFVDKIENFNSDIKSNTGITYGLGLPVPNV